MSLVDTNVLAELVRPDPDPGVTRWVREQRGLFVSVVTVEEIAYGLAWRPKPRIATVLTRLLKDHCTVLPVTQEIAARAGELRGRLQASGHTRSQADMLIAATALTHGYAVVTRNEEDFRGCSVEVVNPFQR
ncbi:MAG: type II toxin-antitoxin system VapC family toxin [Myxococcales bacterium]|nr:type II toxin-antitoxin system VapC family toxin [Myxococcales bacterium]MCB9668102.1 type II toxin-antitoxin system VapC family toxin [Alphaproteobacteria bacterium]MCB9694790.1 type II toxin-antitoxin system VapC family toxin [Alphaproteobacteria bacterium]